jgi:hypothetical protein
MTTKSVSCLDAIGDITERWYGENDPESAISKKLEHDIQSWFQWFETTYPRAVGNKPLELLEENKQPIDFRIFFIAFPIEVFILTRVLDACYSVDKALCGFSSLSSARLQDLQSMDKFEYLCSEELITWREVSFCELDELIKSQVSVSMSDTFQITA